MADTTWWGYSEEHGWIFLDRTIEQNSPGKKKGLLFLRCRDLVLFKVDWEVWCPPPYFYAPNYIESLNSDSHKQASATAEFNVIKTRESEFCNQYKNIKEAVKLKILSKNDELEKKHRTFLESKNIVYHGSSISLSNPRVAYCYNCKELLDSNIDRECNLCKWILCNCGACGCVYQNK